MDGRALLLLDFQEDFSPFGALGVAEAPAMVERANRLLATDGLFEAAVATQNWHPANHVSFAANHYFRYPGQVVENAATGQAQRLWPIYGVQESFGAELMGDLDQTRLDLVLRKGQDATRSAYSAFAPSAVPHLGAWLHARGISDIYLGGFFAEYAVLQTALDGARQGFTIQIITDLCAPKGWDEADADWLGVLNEWEGVSSTTTNHLP